VFCGEFVQVAIDMLSKHAPFAPCFLGLLTSTYKYRLEFKMDGRPIKLVTAMFNSGFIMVTRPAAQNTRRKDATLASIFFPMNFSFPASTKWAATAKKLRMKLKQMTLKTHFSDLDVLSGE
jgi:hypothetical protein